MSMNPSSAFWERLLTGVEVAVASAAADELLGVRDGCLRYFRQGLSMDVPVVIVPHPEDEADRGLHLSDEAAIAAALRRADRLRQQLGEQYHFYVGTEGGVHSLEVEGEIHSFVRAWSVVAWATGQATGSSGSVEIPRRLVSGAEDLPVAAVVPGTRRRGGLIGSLTAGVETRRSAVAVSTLHALSSLLYEVMAPVRPR
jgi:non-canonical (house-cleaning) NTP pyrophosphatase